MLTISASPHSVNQIDEKACDKVPAVEEVWPELAAPLDRTPAANLATTTRRLLADEGITYRPPGEDEQPWTLDPLPLPLTAAAWAEPKWAS
jgi:uncharacterized circularly permuted ATP-grasp superfamily protein